MDPLGHETTVNNRVLMSEFENDVLQDNVPAALDYGSTVMMVLETITDELVCKVVLPVPLAPSSQILFGILYLRHCLQELELVVYFAKLIDRVVHCRCRRQNRQQLVPVDWVKSFDRIEAFFTARDSCTQR